MIIVDESTTRGEVLMFANEFQSMKEYRPEDVPVDRNTGNRWIVDLNFENPEATEHKWYMGEFFESDEDSDMLAICWRKVNLINRIIEIVSADNLGSMRG
jgi:hypothetical protein